MKKINICSGIIIDDFNRVLLIKRGHLLKDSPNYWAVPSGKQDKGEDLEKTAIREIKEEVGLDFVIEKLYIENHLILKEEDKIKYFYRYLGKANGKIIIQKEECDGFGWFTYKEAISLPMMPNMKDLINQLYGDSYL